MSSAATGVPVRGLTRRSTAENGSRLSRAIAKISRELAAAPITDSANMENTTTTRKIPVAVSPSQYRAMAASGTGESVVAGRSGMARVNPTSASMPSTPDTTTDRIIARGTVRRASTASSARSAAASKPTRVKMPTSEAPTIAEKIGWSVDTVNRNPKPCPPSGASAPPRTQAKNTIALSTTVPMISANTATLFTRAASCTRMMLSR